MDRQQEILERIKARRKEKGITQLEISELIGMAKNNYGKVENGRIELTVGRLYQIAEILDISVFSLLGGDDINAGSSSKNAAELEFLREEKAKFDKVMSDLAPLFGFIGKLFKNENSSTEVGQPSESRLSEDFTEKLAQTLKGKLQ